VEASLSSCAKEEGVEEGSREKGGIDAKALGGEGGGKGCEKRALCVYVCVCD
jgi:hypothetical protein